MFALCHDRRQAHDLAPLVLVVVVVVVVAAAAVRTYGH